MDSSSRENLVIGAGVVLAIAAWFIIGAFTELGTAATIAVVIAIGVVLPTLVLEVLSPGHSS